MSLTENKAVDKIEILENGIIQVREALRILRDGVEISKTYHRYALVPGEDISSQPDNVVAICNTVWTPEVIAAYESVMAEQAARQAALNTQASE